MNSTGRKLPEGFSRAGKAPIFVAAKPGKRQVLGGKAVRRSDISPTALRLQLARLYLDRLPRSGIRK